MTDENAPCVICGVQSQAVCDECSLDVAKTRGLNRMVKFCAGGSGRYALQLPFTLPDEPGFLYASDGHILLRAPLDALPAAGVAALLAKRECDPPASASSILGGEVLSRVEWGKSFEAESGGGCACDCDIVRRLHGLLPEESKCRECDGEGQVDCPTCGHEDECDECGGRGTIESPPKCPHCRGEGKTEVVQLAGRCYGSAVVGVVRFVYGQAVEWGVAEGHETAFFRSGEIRGCIASTRKEKA